MSLHHSVPPLCSLRLLASFHFLVPFQPVYLQVFLHFCCFSISYIQFQFIFIASCEGVLLRRIFSAQLYWRPAGPAGLSESTAGLCCISMVSNGIALFLILHCALACNYLEAILLSYCEGSDSLTQNNAQISDCRYIVSRDAVKVRCNIQMQKRKTAKLWLLEGGIHSRIQ
jgi:hypothetical protein